jgi:uncharacterized membrane protein YebE (DUF533 family)
MFDPKKLLDDLLGSQVPGTKTSVRDGAGKAAQMAKDNPLAAGALVAVLLGTKHRPVGHRFKAATIGGLAAIAGLAYKAYQNYQKGNQPAPKLRRSASRNCFRRPPTASSTPSRRRRATPSSRWR